MWSFSRSTAAVLTLALCAAMFVISVIPEAHAAAAPTLSGLLDVTYIAPVVAGVAVDLEALRRQHADLVTRATVKLGEVKEGMPAAEVTRIETEHADLVRQATGVQTQIAEAERAAPPANPNPPANPSPSPAPANERGHTWSADEIGKIYNRATAFGLTAAEALTVMGDANVRTLEAATDKLQDLAATRTAPRQRPQITIGRDEGDTIRTAVETSILLRANPQALKPDAPEREMARNWRGMSLMECGRMFLEEVHGIKLRAMGRMELAGALLGLMSTRAGMHSTSDFANLLANVATKRLRAAYENAPQQWKRIGRQSNNPDFKAKSVVQLSSAPTFKLVRQGEEYTYGGLTDGVESYALATYGRIIAITRQALINDDLSAFDRMPMMLGRAAAELEATTFWSILINSPNMGDGVALFHANHGNLGAAAAINEASLTAGKAAMRKQKSLAAKAADAEPLNLVPAIMAVSPDKEVEAQKMLTAVLATQTSGVNVFQSSMELIVEARLSGNAWYLSADPATVDTIEYAYLEGEEGIFIEQQTGFDVDGIKIKGRLDFAAKAIDWRGLFKNPGA